MNMHEHKLLHKYLWARYTDGYASNIYGKPRHRVRLIWPQQLCTPPTSCARGHRGTRPSSVTIWHWAGDDLWVIGFLNTDKRKHAHVMSTWTFRSQTSLQINALTHARETYYRVSAEGWGAEDEAISHPHTLAHIVNCSVLSITSHHGWPKQGCLHQHQHDIWSRSCFF